MASSSSSVRSRGWVFTLNNYTDADIQHLQGGHADWQALTYGKEIAPETKTEHLQGVVYFTNKKSMAQVR